MLPLSGGADSASVASIVRVMCDLAVVAAVEVRHNCDGGYPADGAGHGGAY